MTTLMVVHAHPDDEVLTTGGLLMRAAEQGLRTVLVTCTGGQAGEIADPDLATPTTLGAVRRRELRAACQVLRISRLHLLGYRDSGMAGSPDNLHPASFQHAPIGQAAARLARLIRQERPDILVTYDDNGFYGHPDHVKANQVTLAAFERADAAWRPRRLYYTAYPHSAIVRHARRLRTCGITPPHDPDAIRPPSFGTPDELITNQLDVSALVDRKLRALRQHASQLCPDFFVSQLSPAPSMSCSPWRASAWLPATLPRQPWSMRSSARASLSQPPLRPRRGAAPEPGPSRAAPQVYPPFTPSNSVGNLTQAHSLSEEPQSRDTGLGAVARGSKEAGDMVIDALGGWWIPGLGGALLLIAAPLLVLWADSGFRSPLGAFRRWWLEVYPATRSSGARLGSTTLVCWVVISRPSRCVWSPR